jgi:ethanolaminephosphotransferase
MLITPQRSAALRAFKYKGQDLSLLYRYVLSPWAQFLVDVATPTWLAPNAITFLGLAPSVATLCIALSSQPDLGPGMAGWVALLCAGSMFFYSTMDNMDGKQARKTGSSSALGLLFDHGEFWCARAPPPAAQSMAAGPLTLSLAPSFTHPRHT